MIGETHSWGCISSSFIVREEGQGGTFPRIERRDGMRLFRFSTRHRYIQIKEEISNEGNFNKTK